MWISYVINKKIHNINMQRSLSFFCQVSDTVSRWILFSKMLSVHALLLGLWFYITRVNHRSIKNTNSPSKIYWTHWSLASRAKIAKIRQEDSVLSELLKLWWTLILTSSISTRLLMVSVVKTKIIPIIFLSFSIQRSILTTIFARLFIAKIQSCSRESFRIWPLM